MQSAHQAREFTKAALNRAVDVARKNKIDQVEVEIPGGSKIVFKGLVSKQEPSQDKELDQWMEKQRARKVQGT